jgi:hypothetical protein
VDPRPAKRETQDEASPHAAVNIVCREVDARYIAASMKTFRVTRAFGELGVAAHLLERLRCLATLSTQGGAMVAQEFAEIWAVSDDPFTTR